MIKQIKLAIPAITAISLLTMIGCGSGSFDDLTADDLTWSEGIFKDEELFKNRCENPRSGTDLEGNSFPDQAGSTLEENNWLRSWSNNTYLWFDEIIDQNPALFASPLDYFTELKSNATTSSGNFKDKFHFTWDTAEYLQSRHSGVSVSYGIEFELISSTPPREVYIRYVESGSPADAAGIELARGAKILEIDSVDMVNAADQSSVDRLNAGLFPSNEGESHIFKVLDSGATEPRTVTLVAAEVTANPVPIVDSISTASGKVGYIFFNDHNFVSEDRLYEAFTQLDNENINDLVLDLRYNGGGYLYIASQLAYMVAGNTATQGKAFEEIRFNDKHPNYDPVTGELLRPTPFYNAISPYSDVYPSGTALPSLELERIFILATGDTCSASEAIINGLRGIDIEVILIGDTTCGKPYGFYATDNCGTTYFTIQFEGVNNKGFGDYSDGFSPLDTALEPGVLVAGCSQVDDLDYQLGDLQEQLLATALSYRESGECPAPVVANSSKYSPARSAGLQQSEGLAIKRLRKFNQKVYLPLKNH